MDTKQFLLEFKSTRDFKAVIPMLVGNSDFRDALFREVAGTEYPFPEYSSWIAIHFFEKHPDLMSHEQCELMLNVLLKTENHTLQRNLTNALVYQPFDCSENAGLLDKCFEFLLQPEALPALKHHAFRLIEKHYLPVFPELVRELKPIFELMSTHPKKSMQSMARNFAKNYKKHPYYAD